MRTASSGRKPLGWLALVFVFAGVIGMETWAAFSYQGYAMTHDESEHIHVVYALQRGERPYRDFIENHPVLPHLLLRGYAQFAGITQPEKVYGAARLAIAAHFLGALLVAWLLLREWSRRLAGGARGAAMFLGAVTFSGVWLQTHEWQWGHRALWHVRPDWIYVFYALTGTWLHYRHFNRLLSGRVDGVGSLLVGAACSAVALAVLAKSVLIFLPYIVAIGLTAMAWPAWATRSWRSNWRPLLLHNLMFVLVAGGLICLLVATEVAATGVTLRDYVTANLTLNSIKHMPVNAYDFNPMNVLRSLWGFGLVGGILASTWYVLKFVGAVRRDDPRAAGGLLMFGAVIAINAVLPAYGNGLTWPHYLIPSLLALWALSTWLIVDAVDLASAALAPGGRLATAVPDGSSIPTIAAAALGIAVSLVIGQRIYAAVDRVAGTIQVRAETARLLDAELPAFLPERWLPQDLVYMVFEPNQKPANARAWGYFHMLSQDTRWWVDNHRYGLGPDPTTYWKDLFLSSPPDVVAISGFEAFLYRWQRLRLSQRTDIDWLWARLVSDYDCVSNLMLQVYVRKDLRHRFDARHWKPCAPQHAVFVGAD